MQKEAKDKTRSVGNILSLVKKSRGWLRCFGLASLLVASPVPAEAVATIWNGPSITFTKTASSDPSLEANQDRITPNVWITRGNIQGIYNAKTEAVYSSTSPQGTEWAYGTTANYSNLTYQNWFTWVANNPPATVGQNAVLHLISEDIYIDIKFTSWSEGRGAPGGAFAYERSTLATVSNSPPSVSITNPANGSSFATPTNLIVQATATDSDGTVASVEFFDGAVSLGSDATSPFSITNNFFPGSHALTSIATDNEGATNVSSTVTISVGSVAITNPIAERIPKGDFTIELQTVAEGMASPLGMAVPDDGSGRMFVYDQAGPIWIVTTNGRAATPLLDVRGRLLPSAKYDYDERGLLGLAVHPNFALHPYIYTYTSETNLGPADFPASMNPSTTPNHQSVIAEWRIDSNNTNRVDPASRREILRIDQPQSNHNGGTMRFGPDGFLYVTLGDGGQANDVGNGHLPGGNAQNTAQILGKLIRIDVNGTSSTNGQYSVPADNPFDGTNGLREIFAYGLRNPFAFSFDKTSGALYLADVGQNKVEEINIITKGGNYGWSIKEGTFWFDPSIGQIVTVPTRPVPPNLIDPIAQYDHDDGLAVIGGYVYRGSQLPELAGRYVFADWGAFNAPSGRLYYLDASNNVKEFRIGLEDRPLGNWIKGFGEDANGEVYVFGSRVVGLAGNTGKMLKIIRAPEPLAFTSIARSNGTNITEVWCGGMGPFALQKKNALSDPTWMNLGFSTETNSASILEGLSGFFRVADTARQPAIPLSVALSGAAERPTPLNNSATGFGLLSLDGNTLTFNIRYGGLSSPAFAAHIHGPASAATATNVLIDLAPYNGGSYGSTGTVSGSIILSDAQKAMVLGGRTYLNFHTTANPGGELRGQIAPVLMQVALSGANSRPPVPKPGDGIGILALVGNQLTFNITYRNLSGVASDAHIHGPASMSENANVIVPFAPFNGGSFGTSGTISGTVTLTPVQLAHIIDGRTYVNFHTVAHGSEIRGQILPQATATPFTAPLTGLSERPTPITNSATGSALFSLEGNALTFSINYAGLSGAAIAAHIHGPATTSQSSNILVDLAPFVTGSFGASGTIAGTALLTDSQRDIVLAGRSYVNIHTPSNPSGEIRGQVAPVLMRAYLSGAEERPALFSNGTGSGTFALVLNRLAFDITYSGLTTTANAAHIHGPSIVSQTGGILVDLAPFNGGSWGTAGSLAGIETLTTAQLGNLVDGLTYVNIHSTTFGGGEIRGQILR